MNDRLAESAPLLKSVGRHKQQNPLQRLDELNRFEGFARELKVEEFVPQEGLNRVMGGSDLDLSHISEADLVARKRRDRCEHAEAPS